MWDFVKSRKLRKRALLQKSMRRTVRGEMLEQRCLMAANPLHIGLLYVETDLSDSVEDQAADDLPDHFVLTFSGGEPDTELTQVSINTDKGNDGLSVADLIFDTAPGGRGKAGWHPFTVNKITAADPRAAVSGVVEDGGMLLTLTLSHFKAGDKIEFSLDVDEVGFNDGTLEDFNSELDEIASGQEFHRSILTATFNAPHYEQATAQDTFINNYADPQAFGLDLPPDSGHPESRPNRSAAAIASTLQVPKPISISGTVFVDDNLNLIRENNETKLPGVQISLWKKDVNGQFVDTGLKTTTDSLGRYQFGTSLGLMPGDYRVMETQPNGYFSVGAVPGTVDGAATGSVVTSDIISEISIPLGDLHAINYDFAEARPAQISGYVYRDDSDDGIRDPNEPGLGGVLIRLEPISTIGAQAVKSMVTNADGSYSFTNLSPGQYRIVEVTQPSPLTDGLDTAGTINGVQVGVAVNPGDMIEAITLNGGQSGIEYNFGELPLGSLSGFVYLPPPGEDCEGDHFGDWLPVEGARIQLYTPGGTLIAETLTLADGSYKFDDLPKGEYRIVEITPAGLIDGTGHVGMIDGVMVGTVDVDGSLSRVRLPAGKDGQRYDFCEAAPARVEGYVYHDASNDGNRDGAEVGIPNAQVRLYDSAGQLVGTTQTDANGHYVFENLLPGTYRIEEVTPQGYLDGLDKAGTIAGLFVGAATNPGDLISSIVLKQGQAGVEYNFGELVPATIQGRVHADVNGNCELDAGEATLQGVIIRLLDDAGNQVAQTTTDADGNYRFTGLRPGKYTVIQVQPAGFFSGGQKAGSTGGDASVENQIRNITLASADESVGNDFCENPPSRISGRVHADRDGDCVYDPGEPVLANVRIELLDSNGNVIETTTTNANGQYEFTNLKAGRYTVRETQPVGYLQGGQSAGSGGGDASQTDLISQIEIGWGETLIDYNFCELEPASIAGTVFIDSDGDCIHEPALGETGLSGVTIRLHDSTGRIIATTITNANGDYRFDNLRPGEYQISEVQPTGLFHGGQTVGSGGGRVGGDDLLTQILIGAGNRFVDYDFCEIEPSSIAGIVFVDQDQDCVYEPGMGERPLSNVTIELRDANNNLVATTVTDSSGQYRFENLRPGEYSVFEVQPTGFFHGGENVGSGGGLVTAQDLISQIMLGPGTDLVNYDFCELDPSSIQGIVHVDDDGDCIYEPAAGEQPLAGVVIELLDANGNIVATTQTNASGIYRFENLPPGEYSVREIQPAGYFQGGQRVGSGGGRIAGDDLISQIVLGPGTDLVDYDFCEIEPASIQGIVHVDDDGDCIYEPAAGEQPLAGVVVELLDENGNVVATTQTNASGIYRFDNLEPGDYAVREVQPVGYLQGGQRVGSGGGRVAGVDLIADIPLGPGQNLINYDFCEVEPSTIGGRVWSDTIVNRRFDDGEAPIGNVLIELLDANGTVIATQRTNDEGIYQFRNLRPGTYTVRETQPTGYFHIGQAAGSHGGNDTADDIISAIEIPAGEDLIDYDFVEQPPAIISGFVFQDGSPLLLNEDPDPLDLRKYRDGQLTDDDTRLAGVVLELRMGDGKRAGSEVALPGTYSGDVIRVVTDENGYYEFTGIRSLIYSIYQVQPEGFVDGLDTEGTFGGLAVNAADLENDPDTSFLVTTLSANPETNPNFDAILRIDVLPATHSRLNNFSEIRVDPSIPPPTDIPPSKPPEQPPVVFDQFQDPDLIYLAYTPAPYKPYQIGTWANGVTWHLSIINGGAPRGADLDSDAVMRPASSGDAMLRWTSEISNVGEWRLFDAEGLEVKSQRPVMIGVVDGIPLVGDFNGDGQDEFAIYVAGEWLVDLNGDGAWDEGDLWVQLGSDLDRPVIGDWDGDGKDDIGIFGPEWERDAQVIPNDPGLPDPDNILRRGHKNTPPTEESATDGKRLLKKTQQGKLRADVIDHVFRYGSAADVPMAGDWNGDGIDAIAIYRNGQWLLDLDGDGRWTERDGLFEFGQPGDVPIVADFNGDGIDELAIVRGNVWIIDSDGDRRLTAADARIELDRRPGEQPVAGDWDGDGRAEPGYYRVRETQAEDPAA